MHIQATARGAACPGGGLEEQEVGQAGAEQVLHLPLELDPPLAAGELVGLRDKWSAGKGGKSRRTGENWLPLSGPSKFQCFLQGRPRLTNLPRLDGDGSFTSQLMWSGEKTRHIKYHSKFEPCSVVAFWDRPWVWNTAHCWYNYPFHPLGLSPCVTRQNS